MQIARYSCPVSIKFIFPFDRFSKNTQIPNFMKILPVGAEMFHADRQTDTTKLTVALRNFTKAPKKIEVRKEAEGKKGEEESGN
jgi:hypothetical protein